MKLNYKRTFFVGLAFMSICSFWQLYDNIIPLILKNSFHVDDFWSGVLMAADNILALFMLPLFGMLSDRTNTRFGKRTPFILFGTIAAVIGMIFIPLADNNNSLFLFFTALGLVLIAMSTYRSPAVALMPDVTPKPLRSKANAVINLMGAVGGIITLLLIKFLVSKGTRPNYMNLYIAVAAIMVVAVIILLITIRENRLIKESDLDSGKDKLSVATGNENMPPDVKKSFVFLLVSVFLWFVGYNAVTTAFSKYAQTCWQLEGGDFAQTLMIANVAAILSYIPVGIISSKLGRKKTIQIGLCLLIFAFGSVIFFKSWSTLIFLFFALAGIGWALVNVNSYPMVVEMSKGSDIGKYTGFYYTFSMSAQILTPILSGFLLKHVGYWTLFPYGTFFIVLSFITLLFVMHGDNKPLKPASKLEAFCSQDD